MNLERMDILQAQMIRRPFRSNPECPLAATPLMTHGDFVLHCFISRLDLRPARSGLGLPWQAVGSRVEHFCNYDDSEGSSPGAAGSSTLQLVFG